MLAILINYVSIFKKKKSYKISGIPVNKNLYDPFFMDRVQLPQGYSHFEEVVYFLPLRSQKFMVLILSTSEVWKAESTLEPFSGQWFLLQKVPQIVGAERDLL